MRNQTNGEVSIEEMVEIISNYIKQNPKDKYKISIGTDSQSTNLTKVVIAVSIHIIGKGGIFFSDEKLLPKIPSIREKIYFETSWSLDLALQLSELLAQYGITQEIEIHSDIGKNKKGKTYTMVQEITGWINQAGFRCVIKPYSYTASCIADKLSK